MAEATRSFPVLNNTTPGQLFTALVITSKLTHTHFLVDPLNALIIGNSV